MIVERLIVGDWTPTTCVFRAPPCSFQSFCWGGCENSEAESLFVLVRDVPEFEKEFATDVLAFVKELGFTGQSKEPQRIVQEGCLPFDPTSGAQKVRMSQFAVATPACDVCWRDLVSMVIRLLRLD